MFGGKRNSKARRDFPFMSVVCCGLKGLRGGKVRKSCRAVADASGSLCRLTLVQDGGQLAAVFAGQF